MRVRLRNFTTNERFVVLWVMTLDPPRSLALVQTASRLASKDLPGGIVRSCLAVGPLEDDVLSKQTLAMLEEHVAMDMAAAVEWSEEVKARIRPAYGWKEADFA